MEYIHDELVSKVWKGSDPVGQGEYRDRGLLESATARPFHTAFGQDVYPSVLEKAVALFHLLISNHPFHNGNKRTAVLAFDIFLVANGYFAVLGNDAMYKLAEQTAKYRERGLTHEDSLTEILNALDDLVISLSALKAEGKKDANVARLYRSVIGARRKVRRNELNKIMPSS